MTVVTIVLITGSLSTQDIVASQAHGIIHWNFLRLGIVPFLIFLTAITAELNRPPFDVVEAESELVGGFHTEYSSLRFALFFLAEFMNTITMSAVMVTLFFGGPAGWVPNIAHIQWVFPILWFLGKTVIFCFCYVWFRAALPRMRYDQLMDLGWKRLIPLSLAWMLLVAGFLISPAWGFGLMAAGIAGSILLTRSFEIGREREAGPEAVLPTVGARPISPTTLRQLTDGEESSGRCSQLLRRLQADLPTPLATDGDVELPGREATEAAPSTRPSRAESVRGRHGKVHRLRVVRRCLPGRLHLRAWTGQPARSPGQPR
jgi:NADH-quinone oxidoreductase subunit H